MKQEHYWRLYDFEWQLRERLTSWLQVPIGVMTLIGGGGVVMASKFRYAHDAATYAFIVFLVASFAFLVAGTIFLARSFHGYRYVKLSRPDQLRDFYLRLIVFHEASGRTAAAAEADFEDYLNRRLAEATTTNAASNARKSQFLHLATAMTLSALALLGCAAIPFLIASSQPFSSQLAVAAARSPVPLEEHRNVEPATTADPGERSGERARGAGDAAAAVRAAERTGS